MFVKTTMEKPTDVGNDALDANSDDSGKLKEAEDDKTSEESTLFVGDVSEDKSGAVKITPKGFSFDIASFSFADICIFFFRGYF